MTDAGYDVARLAWVPRHLPVELVGRIRGDRVMRLPSRHGSTPRRAVGCPSMVQSSASPSRRHGPNPWSRPARPRRTTASPSRRRGTGVPPRLPHRPARLEHEAGGLPGHCDSWCGPRRRAATVRRPAPAA
ncbi:transposase [Streptomyces scopuliridis]|uniref:transposase n=1 Tax=Streptomyces scopuliridis TaxID=452529 RepID=UPI00389AE8FB